MFNDYMWQTYLNAGGEDLVAFFEKNMTKAYSKEYAKRIFQLHKAYCPSSFINKDCRMQLLELFQDARSEDFCSACYRILDLEEDDEYSIFDLVEMLYDEIKMINGFSDSQTLEEFVNGMAYYTTFIFILYPEISAPYYYECNFNVLEKIANEFGFELPELPVKKDYKGRFFYYAKLCEVFYDFRVRNKMSPYEFCAFLYDFAPKYIGGIDSYIIKDLPPAKGAYLIGGTKDDAFLSDDDDYITAWQCNPETLAGDNIVMYLKSPISAIDSVWRSVSVGFNDPFFYYYRCTYIAHPKKIKRVTLKTMERDKVFRELPIVRKNMQGLNGVELYPSAYNHLLDISKTDLPKLEFWENEDTIDLLREKDVENKLVKPFLTKLGYSEDDYVQQLYIEIGNQNHALIPDFVVNPRVSKGHHAAEFLIEAKYSVKSEKDFEKYKTQARSYANQLKAKYSAIASKEGIWISSETDDFSRDFIVLSWNELNDDDNFYRVFKLLGKGNVLKSANTRKRLNGRATEYLMFLDEE